MSLEQLLDLRISRIKLFQINCSNLNLCNKPAIAKHNNRMRQNIGKFLNATDCNYCEILKFHGLVKFLFVKNGIE